jgi:hypothetical protein
VTFILATVRSLVNSYFYIFIPISQISEAGHLSIQMHDFRSLPCLSVPFSSDSEKRHTSLPFVPPSSVPVSGNKKGVYRSENNR